jgi:hypothetical protein
MPAMTRPIPKAKAKKQKPPVGPQVARGTDKVALARARRLLLALAPPGATDVAIGITTFRRSKTAFEARAFLRWIPARGRVDRADGNDATGASANEALDALIEKLERGELRDRSRSKTKTKKKTRTKGATR